MATRGELERAFWYMAITTTVPIMAFLGYVLGREWGKEMIGALLGTLAGTFLVWFDILRAERVFRRRKTGWQTAKQCYLFLDNGSQYYKSHKVLEYIEKHK